jgi:hypothetical protein
MKNYLKIALSFAFISACHPAVERSQLDNASWELGAMPAACENEMATSGLKGRLAFCQLSKPTAIAVTSCLNNTFSKISSFSQACKPYAGNALVSVNAPLLTYQAGQMLRTDQGQPISFLDIQKLKDLIKNIDQFFTYVKSVDDLRVYRRAIQAYNGMEADIFTALRISSFQKLSTTKVQNGLHSTPAAIAGLSSDMDPVLAGLRNIEVSLTFVVPALKSVQEEVDVYGSSYGVYCNLNLCQGELNRYRDAAKTLADIHQDDTPQQTSNSFELVKGLKAQFIGKTKDLRTYLFVSQNSLPELEGKSLKVAETFNIAKNQELSIDSKQQTAFDFVSLLNNFEIIRDKFNYRSDFTVLEFGLDDSSRFAISQKISRDLADFELARTTFLSQQVDEIRREIAKITDQGQAENLDASRRAKTIELKQLFNQVAVAQNNLEKLEAERSRYIVDFSSLNSTVLGEAQQIYQFKGELPKLNIGLKDGPELENLAMSPTSSIRQLTKIEPLEIKPGETLNIRITGEWSPICALSKSRYASATNGVLPRVGPSGFIVSDNKSDSTITSVTRSDTTAVSSSYEDSTTIGGGLGLTYQGANLGISRNWTSRNSTEKSSSLTKSTTEQNVVSSTAQFQRGIGLQGTPFADLPAGALLILRVPAQSVDTSNPDNPVPIFSEQFDDIKGIKVAEENFTLTAAEFERYFLVINDCKASEEVANRSETLSFSATKFALVDSVAESRKVIAAMGEATTLLEKDAAETLKEGGAVLSKLAATRSLALAKINATNLSSLPPERAQMLLNYFQSFVDYVHGKILRQVEIHENMQKAAILSEELEGYEQLLQSFERSKRLRDIETLNAANNSEEAFLYGKASNLLRVLQSQAIPMLRLYYPERYAKLIKSLNSGLIINGSETSGPNGNELWLKIKLLSEKVKEAVEASEIQVLTRERRVVAITFLRPGLTEVPRSLTKIPTAPLDASKVFWDMIFKGGEDKGLDLSPEHIYERSGQRLYNNFNLSCNMTSVVINHMGLFMFTDSGTVDASELNQSFGLNVRLGPDMSIPTRNGRAAIRLFDENWGNTSLKAVLVDTVGFNDLSKTLLADESAGLVSARGLSPFARMSVTDSLDFSSFASDSQGYPEAIAGLTLAFVVETDKASPESANSWISACIKPQATQQ